MVIAAKVAASLCGLITLIVIARLMPGLPEPRWRVLLAWAYVLSRAGLFTLVYAVAGVPAMSDVTVYYSDATAVRGGAIPFADFATAYGPLFPYLAAVPTLVVDSATSIVFVSTLFEAIALPVWVATGDRLFGRAITTRALAAYVCCPLSFVNVPITGQNHIWLSLLLALAVLALLRGRVVSSALWLGVSVVAVKFLSLLWAPAFWVTLRRRGIWTAAFLLPIAIGYGTVWWLGGDIIAQVRFHGSDGSSGNLPFLLGAAGVDLSGPGPRTLANLAALGILTGVFLAAVVTGRLGRPDQLVLGLPLLLLVVMLVSKKAFASYLEIVLFPLCLAFARLTWSWRVLLAGGLFAALATVEPTLWFRWMHVEPLQPPWRWPPDRAALTAVFVAVEVALVGMYLVALRTLWQQLGRSPGPPG